MAKAIECPNRRSSKCHLPATPPARLLSVIGIARCIARDMFRLFSLSQLVVVSSTLFASAVSFFFERRDFLFLCTVCQNSQNSLSAKNPKAMADKSGGKCGGRLLPKAPPPKLANHAPEALHTEMRAFAAKERLWLEIPTDRPTIKLSVDEASASRKASRNRGIFWLYTEFTFNSQPGRKYLS